MIMPMAKGKKDPAKLARTDPKRAEPRKKSAEKATDVQVEIGPAAQRQFDELPLPIQARAREVFMRLRKWPNVSGAKPLKGDYAGSYRIRTGDYRLVFKPLGNTKLNVWKIGDRKDVYLD
jgi:mRNA-degrading endonuclease RelE of RelBE toxin-antitoxin system